MAEQRSQWNELLAKEPATALVFVDESGATTKMTRLQRGVGVPHNDSKSVKSLRSCSSALIPFRIVGPCAQKIGSSPPASGQTYRAHVLGSREMFG